MSRFYGPLGIECQWSIELEEKMLEELFAMAERSGSPISGWRNGDVSRDINATVSKEVPVLLFCAGVGMVGERAKWHPFPAPIPSSVAASLASAWLRDEVSWDDIHKFAGDGSNGKGFIFRTGRHLDQAYGFGTGASVAIEPVYNYYGK